MNLLSILVIRRDNIGDLVCTTPLFSALRRHFPNARITALVNSYNAPVLAGNTDLDEVYVYRKAKHRIAGESRYVIWWKTWKLMRRLRKENFDIAIVATPARQAESLKFAHWVRAKRVIAYGEASDGIDSPLSILHTHTGHETEAVMRLLQPLGINEMPSPTHIATNTRRVEAVPAPAGEGQLIALHISARKPSQRWPVERFAELAHTLYSLHQTRFLLFWSPGSADNVQHPGDDEKANRLMALCHDLPLLACPTHQLEDLIIGLARCDRVICSDGGAMHLAAGLNKPIVCFFGNSNAERWRPWGVAYELLQPSSLNVIDITVNAALAAFESLEQRLAENNDELTHPA